jgi:hypothetical protein
VPDERLARYLAQLLDENLDAALAPSRPTIQLVDASRKPEMRKSAGGRSDLRSRAK